MLSWKKKNESKEGHRTEDLLIGFCGVDCAACTDYTEKKCPGCRASEWPDGDPCPPIACCGKRKIDFCGQCADFPCAMMQEFYEESDSHRAAGARMAKLAQG